MFHLYQDSYIDDVLESFLGAYRTDQHRLHRLRIALVGEVRRRLAASLAQARKGPSTEEVLFVAEEEDEEESDGEGWSPVATRVGNGDPLEDQCNGGRARFRVADDSSSDQSLEQSPSTPLLCQRAMMAGISQEDIASAFKFLQDSSTRIHVVASVTPPAVIQPVSTARKIVSKLFQCRMKPSNQWQSPLPPERVLPQLTLDDCPVRDQHSKEGDRRSPELGNHSGQNSKVPSDPSSREKANRSGT